MALQTWQKKKQNASSNDTRNNDTDFDEDDENLESDNEPDANSHENNSKDNNKNNDTNDGSAAPNPKTMSRSNSASHQNQYDFSTVWMQRQSDEVTLNKGANTERSDSLDYGFVSKQVDVRDSGGTVVPVNRISDELKKRDTINSLSGEDSSWLPLGHSTSFKRGFEPVDFSAGSAQLYQNAASSSSRPDLSGKSFQNHQGHESMFSDDDPEPKFRESRISSLPTPKDFTTASANLLREAANFFSFGAAAEKAEQQKK